MPTLSASTPIEMPMQAPRDIQTASSLSADAPLGASPSPRFVIRSFSMTGSPPPSRHRAPPWVQPQDSYCGVGTDTDASHANPPTNDCRSAPYARMQWTPGCYWRMPTSLPESDDVFRDLAKSAAEARSLGHSTMPPTDSSASPTTRVPHAISWTRQLPLLARPQDDVREVRAGLRGPAPVRPVALELGATTGSRRQGPDRRAPALRAPQRAARARSSTPPRSEP